MNNLLKSYEIKSIAADGSRSHVYISSPSIGQWIQSLVDASATQIAIRENVITEATTEATTVELFAKMRVEMGESLLLETGDSNE